MGNKLIVGVNDLATVRPDLVKEWHPTKNGDLKPSDVTCGSHKNVWWYLPYDDPKTGKHFDFEWNYSVKERCKNKMCPYLSVSPKRIWKGFNDLVTVNPKLAKEWHPTKNGDLTPYDVTANSNKKVWWYLSYDDPNTGKHFDFEWQADIASRNTGLGCPYLSGRYAWKGFNDLTTTNPELAKQWHPIKNGMLKPTDVTMGSDKKVWWFLPYDDSKTGKHFDFEWQTTIVSRSSGGGCPYLTGKVVWKGFNDLATVNPELTKEWHSIKNGGLKPEYVTCKSNLKVWWHCKEGHEWAADISSRTSGTGCPYCSRRNAIKGVSDLATTHPELAKEWHPTKNGNLKPEDVSSGSDKKVWWFLPYDDPKTGKHFDFEWQATIGSRSTGLGCPYLSGRYAWQGFNDLATLYPDIVKEWHPTKNGDSRPESVTCGTRKKFWWLLPYDVPDDYPIESLRGKHFDFEWQATVVSRSHGVGCPFLSNPVKGIWKGFNDLATTNPELAKEWHPTKNGNLKPSDVLVSSSKKVWWYLPYDDPKTGKHFDFEWQADPEHRSRGRGCPYLYGNAIWKGFNDLASLYPEIAKEWHPTKNGNLRPEDVTSKCHKNVWWYLSYDDPKTGEHFDYEWKSSVSNRTKGNGCPYVSESNGEQDIRKYLEAYNIEYKFEKSFDELKGVGGNPLSYDFWIKGTEVFIEYQGIQHYKPIGFFGGEDALKKQKEHDRRKRQYAKKHGYHLIEIHYKYDTYEQIRDYLDEHLIPLLNL